LLERATVLFHPVEQSVARQPKQLGGPALIAMRVFRRLPNQRLLKLLQVDPLWGQPIWDGCKRCLQALG
jgi:hypothetical protein